MGRSCTVPNSWMNSLAVFQWPASPCPASTCLVHRVEGWRRLAPVILRFGGSGSSIVGPQARHPRRRNRRIYQRGTAVQRLSKGIVSQRPGGGASAPTMRFTCGLMVAGRLSTLSFRQLSNNDALRSRITARCVSPICAVDLRRLGRSPEWHDSRRIVVLAPGRRRRGHRRRSQVTEASLGAQSYAEATRQFRPTRPRDSLGSAPL